MKKISDSSNCLVSGKVEQVKILLDHGCKYDEEIKEKICTNFAKKSVELQLKMEQVFYDHENSGQSIKPVKR